MAQSGFAHVAVLLLTTAGVAALLAGEFFHGVEFLVPAGGGLLVLGVAALTVLVGRAEADAGHGH
jgi:hypothetical protein